MPGLLGGTQETNTTSTSKPWPGVKKILNTSMRDALKLYRQRVGSNPGSNVVPMAKDTVAANDEARRIAQANSNGQGLSQQYQSIINSGGYNPEMQSAIDNLKTRATSSYNPATSGFEDVLKSTLRDAGSAVDESAAAAGRYGSGTHEGVKQQTLGDLSANARYGDFQNWMNDRNSAVSQLGNLGQAGIGNLDTAYSGLQNPIRTQAGIGAQFEDLMRRQIEDKNRALSDPWTQLGRLGSIAGLGSGYGTTSGTTVAPGPNPWLQGLGIASTGYGLLNGMGILGGKSAGVGAGGTL